MYITLHYIITLHCIALHYIVITLHVCVLVSSIDLPNKGLPSDDISGVDVCFLGMEHYWTGSSQPSLNHQKEINSTMNPYIYIYIYVESNTCQSMDAYEHMSGGDLAGTSGSGENRAPTCAFLLEED